MIDNGQKVLGKDPQRIRNSMSPAVSFVKLCGSKEGQGADISSGDISLDIRTSDIGPVQYIIQWTLGDQTLGDYDRGGCH